MNIRIQRQAAAYADTLYKRGSDAWTTALFGYLAGYKSGYSGHKYVYKRCERRAAKRGAR